LLADNPALGRKLGHLAREYVAEHYNRDVLAGRFLRLMEDLVGVEAVEEIPAPLAGKIAERVDLIRSKWH
jgi:hypothetical protein